MSDDGRESANLSSMTVVELLNLHARVAAELRARGVTRTSNNPTGDLAEVLFCRAFDWQQTGNSNANLDAVSSDGARYQIKGRRLTRLNGSRQLSAIRDLDGAHFDFLAGVLFAEDYSVIRAVIVPRAAVAQRATFVSRTNSHKFFLRDDVWELPGARDVTAELRAVNFDTTRSA